MKSELLARGMELLVSLDESGKTSFPELEDRIKIYGDELRKLLNYLKEKGYIKYVLALSINGEKLGESTIELLPKGMEVVLGERDYFDASEKVSQTIHNQTNVTNSSEVQVAQTTGDNSPITQTQDNSQTIILKKMIEDDQELDSEKKSRLKEVVDNINKLKQAGETTEKIYSWVKKGIGICAKYGAYLWMLC